MTKTIGLVLLTIVMVAGLAGRIGAQNETPQTPPCGGWILWARGIDREMEAASWITAEGFSDYASCQSAMQQSARYLRQHEEPLDDFRGSFRHNRFPSNFDPRPL